jgi:hypothetical protein
VQLERLARDCAIEFAQQVQPIGMDNPDLRTQAPHGAPPSRLQENPAPRGGSAVARSAVLRGMRGLIPAVTRQIRTACCSAFPGPAAVGPMMNGCE